MTKTTLVKIGVSSEQAAGVRLRRRIDHILEQHDAAVNRLTAAMKERIREAVTTETEADGGESAPPAAATA